MEVSSLHGTVKVRVMGVFSSLQTWQTVTVVVKASGTWSGPWVQVGVSPVHVSVTVYVFDVSPPGHVWQMP